MGIQWAIAEHQPSRYCESGGKAARVTEHSAHNGLDAPITGVTVFRDGARVVRAGTVRLEAGLRTVSIADLPASVDPASVRLAARGPDVALLSVEVRRISRADPLRDESARLRSEVDRCRDAVQALDDEDAAERARLDFAGHLSEAAATALAKAVGSGRAGHDALAAMADQLSASTASALARRRDIGARRRAAERDLEAAERRLKGADGRSARPAASTEVSAILEVGAAAEAEVEVSYHVAGASWRALYDLGLAGEALAVSYLAEITQRTGEDWPAADVVLSTARRGQHATVPELEPWYIGRAVPFRAHMLRAVAASGAVPSDDAGAPAAPPAARAPQALSADAALVAEPGEAGAGQTYRVPRPLAVPADGSPAKTTIARLEFAAQLDHIAVPVLAPEAYLRATVTNGSPLLLLPGPARVFHDGRFVGQTELGTVAPGEEFELQLGVDDQIRVERELRRRSTGKAIVGGTRSIDLAYETTVRNHRPDAARVVVHDHIPVSTDGEIKVRLREASPGPSAQDDLGELTWELALASGQAATIRHRFTVEHPAQVTVTGL